MRRIFSDSVFSYISPEARVPASHPLRNIQRLCAMYRGVKRRWIGALTQFWCSWVIPRRSVWPEADRYCHGRTFGAARA
jgi:hypothetical protein